MFKVLDVFKVGNNVSVTFEGKCETLKNGCKLRDNAGNIYRVVSVGMTRHENPGDISKSTTVLLSPCNLKKGNVLYTA